jgi:hypothetical protein
MSNTKIKYLVLCRLESRVNVVQLARYLTLLTCILEVAALNLGFEPAILRSVVGLLSPSIQILGY